VSRIELERLLKLKREMQARMLAETIDALIWGAPMERSFPGLGSGFYSNPIADMISEDDNFAAFMRSIGMEDEA
jgi:hypothetical protein